MDSFKITIVYVSLVIMFLVFMFSYYFMNKDVELSIKEVQTSQSEQGNMSGQSDINSNDIIRNIDKMAESQKNQ